MGNTNFGATLRNVISHLRNVITTIDSHSRFLRQFSIFLATKIFLYICFTKIYQNTIKIMCFEGTLIEIKRFRKTNCTRIFYAHVIVEIIAG